MLLQWCLKGIAANGSFNDAAAARALTRDGLASAWMLQNHASTLLVGTADSHDVLSKVALDSHVNNFGVAHFQTPYISLTAGCVTADPVTGATTVHSARDTAIGFATGGVWGGPLHDGYIFKLWVLVTPKPAPELPGFGEEVRDLNQFQQFGLYHHEGEIAGKLVVPFRQIQCVEKFDGDGNSKHVDWSVLGLDQNSKGGANVGWNKEFVQPEQIHNLREML
jgi:hypothetical protein